MTKMIISLIIFYFAIPLSVLAQAGIDTLKLDTYMQKSLSDYQVAGLEIGIAIGESVLSNENQKFWFCHNSGSYYIADPVYFLIFDGSRAIELYNYKNDSLLQSNIINEKLDITENLEKNLKAILQNYQYRMEKNLLTDTVAISSLIGD